MKLTTVLKTLATVCTVALTQLGSQAQAKETIPGVAEQPATYFYTGKPYDSDLGSYTFNARNFDPEINRWTSADPSGFPDGANQFTYVQNSILNSCDPNGLQKIVIEEYYSLIKSQTFTFAMLASTAAAGGAAGSSLVPKTIPAQILATLGSAAAAAYSGATIAFQVFQQQMNNDYDIGSSNIYGDYQSNYEFTFPNQSTRTGSSDMCNNIAFTSDWNDQGFTYSGLVMSTRTFTYE